ncbi:hypothetical protein PGTUg99_027902 [Puccinia graminis f. sp. tritici]|uniref:Uncharacterized protein n=1 Tax=Puccinia graminis f. sp. tritici TaxID=56615 RepID=A0A5B0NKD3_PUCGR|nr:hypothetical protein PGTUg99_027902 [Puccinia graminis f. sp. tritici]
MAHGATALQERDRSLFSMRADTQRIPTGCPFLGPDWTSTGSVALPPALDVE